MLFWADPINQQNWVFSSFRSPLLPTAYAVPGSGLDPRGAHVCKIWEYELHNTLSSSLSTQGDDGPRRKGEVTFKTEMSLNSSCSKVICGNKIIALSVILLH